MRIKLLVGLSACALAATIATAQTSRSQSANRMTADNTFITKAAEGGMAEVELGKLATSHASNDRVKQFGQKMVDDHSKANNELSQIASKKGVTVPTSLAAKDQATVDKLSKLNGAEFDKAYMDDMVKDHRTDVSEFQKEANSGTDPDVKAFAAKTVPTLQQHLQMAETTYNEVKK